MKKKHVSNTLTLCLATLLTTIGCQSPKQSCCDTQQRFVSLFNGKDFTHWDHTNDGVWTIEDGAIVTGDLNEIAEVSGWIYTHKSFSDFELHLDTKLVGDIYRNSGVWYRATPFLFKGHDQHDVEEAFMAPAAYEYDMFVLEKEEKEMDEEEDDEEEDEDDEEDYDEQEDRWKIGNYWASISDWFIRPDYTHLVNQEKVNKALKSQDWNHITIRCKGNHIQHWLNGELLLDHIDTSPHAHFEGKLGLQVRDGTKTKIYFKNICIKELK